MRHAIVLGCALAGLSLAAPAMAETQEQLLTQGPPKTSQPLPDPGHIPMIFGKDIPWKGSNGEQSANLFGDPGKPGIYGVLIKWEPGPIPPHFHSTDRYDLCRVGYWWVSQHSIMTPAMYPRSRPGPMSWTSRTPSIDGAKAETGPASDAGGRRPDALHPPCAQGCQRGARRGRFYPRTAKKG